MKNSLLGIDRWLYRFSMWSAHHPLRILACAIILAILSVMYTVWKLDFETSRNDLVDPDEPAVARFEEISDDFGRLTNVIVVVEGSDLERMKAFAVRLAERLSHETQYFGNILYRINTESLEGKKLIFLSPEDLENLKDKLDEYGELIEELAFEPSLLTIFSYVNQKISEATVTHLVGEFLGKGNGEDKDKEVESEPAKDPVDLSFLRSLLTELRLAMEPHYSFHSPWDTFFKASKKFSYDGFLVSDDERFLYITLEAKSQKDGFTKKKAAIDRLREHIKDLRTSEFGDLLVGVTGGTALSTDEMSQAMSDTQKATVISIIGIAALFIFVFRQIYNPLLVMITLVISIAWMFGWLTLTVGSLNILSVTFVPMLIGLGVDFGIHFVARYSEERGHGQGPLEAIYHSTHSTGQAIVVGALTTAFAFFSLMLANFRGIQELGFIAGCGIILALIATFSVFPAFITFVDKHRNPTSDSRIVLHINIPIVLNFIKHYKIVLTILVLAIIVAIVGISKVYFDYNLLRLQARGTESVIWEEKIVGESGRSSWFAVTTAQDIEELRRKHEAFESLPSVRKVDSLADMLPEDQDTRISLIRGIAPYVPNIELQEIVPSGDDPRDLLDILEKIKFKLRTDTKWDPAKKPDEHEIAITREALLMTIDILKANLDYSDIVDRINVFERKLFDDFLVKFRLLKNNVDPPSHIREEDIPSELLSRFKGKSGHYLLQIYSKENIWEKANMERFIKELKTVDPYITGSPVVGYLAILAMQQGYLEGSIYALCAIIIMITLILRKVSYVFYACTPLCGTIVLTLGVMGWTNIPFNLANLVALPLVLGIVVDDGVHFIHRYVEKGGNLQNTLSGGLIRAISLTSWTTMIGFGSLLLAHHYGIFTLGVLVVVAVGIAWSLSLFGLPALIQLIRRDRSERDKKDEHGGGI